MDKKYCTAIVLAGGRGTRMGTKVHKQYLQLAGKPVLYYSLETFQKSEVIDEVILVTGKGEEEFCRTEFAEKYNFTKITKIVSGGEERYDSVWNGLKEVSDREGYVFIHDGARPFVDVRIVERAYREVQVHGACVAGMPVKDTIKVSDAAGYVSETPDRSRIWSVQTPQVFETGLIKNAYSLLMQDGNGKVTDDAMVVEKMTGHAVKLIEGSYENIKITTPEDLEIGEIFVSHRK
ncbi:MAG: 2-C-methyl-D-erythritol 4-phosphate cytidylyltransferase [Schaedlerella sp.]|nr:2-C-methyl-D-erythritol 4-phosphate cytidylyltransferase [Lachnospiraceae bacterium]MDY4202475.1 2-C-methyl-D-erythritol 4-phosphate cytidylyltransferase [Schaedlerella sp.]